MSDNIWRMEKKEKEKKKRAVDLWDRKKKKRM